MYTRIYKEASTFQVLQQKFWMRFLSSQLQATHMSISNPDFITYITSGAEKTTIIFFNPPYTDIT
jgi:hypothetical protein